MSSSSGSPHGLSEQHRETKERLPTLTSFVRKLRGSRMTMVPHPGPTDGEQPVGGKSGALRAAMTEIRARRPHPYYWAPFFLVGRPWDSPGERRDRRGCEEPLEEMVAS